MLEVVCSKVCSMYIHFLLFPFFLPSPRPRILPVERGQAETGRETEDSQVGIGRQGGKARRDYMRWDDDNECKDEQRYLKYPTNIYGGAREKEGTRA